MALLMKQKSLKKWKPPTANFLKPLKSAQRKSKQKVILLKSIPNPSLTKTLLVVMKPLDLVTTAMLTA